MTRPDRFMVPMRGIKAEGALHEPGLGALAFADKMPALPAEHVGSWSQCTDAGPMGLSTNLGQSQCSYWFEIGLTSRLCQRAIDTRELSGEKSRHTFHDDEYRKEAETMDLFRDGWRGFFTDHRFALRGSRRFDTAEHGEIGRAHV